MGEGSWSLKNCTEEVETGAKVIQLWMQQNVSYPGYHSLTSPTSNEGTPNPQLVMMFNNISMTSPNHLSLYTRYSCRDSVNVSIIVAPGRSLVSASSLWADFDTSIMRQPSS